MSIAFFQTQGAGERDVVVAFDPSRTDAVLTADSNHPNYQAIVDGLHAGDTSVFELFDIGRGLIRQFEKITERVSYDGRNILWDGDAVHTVLAEQLQRALESGEDNYEAIAKFWEKLETNPNEHSKAQAYNWLSTHDFKITAEGDVVGYKGVRKTEDGFRSISSGTAFVDGVQHKGTIPNAIGTVVTMPRSEVAHDPSVACHYGLHVGDWSYASDFAQGAVLEVHVNPRDIVSVPDDHSYRKVRTCRYTVVGVVTEEYEGGPVLKPAAVAETWAGDVGYKV